LAGINCTWTFGDGSTTVGCGAVNHMFTEVGCYDVSLQVENAQGCVNSATYPNYICVEGNPNAAFYFSPATLNSSDLSTQTINTSTGATAYYWDFGDGTTSAEENPAHTFISSGNQEYEVMLVAISNAGCVDTTYNTIIVNEEVVFYIPNAFTPDGDAHNQTFQPVFSSGVDPKKYKLLIFDRWGEVIFESDNYDVGWDGAYGGELVQDGTYIWKVEFGEAQTDKRQTHTGHVTLLR